VSFVSRGQASQVFMVLSMDAPIASDRRRHDVRPLAPCRRCWRRVILQQRRHRRFTFLSVVVDGGTCYAMFLGGI
jgi:hypothetical protein